MTRWAAAAVLTVAVAAAGYAAGAACQSGGPAQQQPAAAADADQPADNLAAVVRADALRERLEIMKQWGFSLQDLRIIGAYKRRMHALHSQLEDALQNLAVVMYTLYQDPDQQRKAARDALEKCRQIKAQDEKLQQELIDRLGANDDPVKMAGLILLGAVDGGRRTLCQVRPGVAGGAQPTGGLGRLRSGRPPRSRRRLRTRPGRRWSPGSGGAEQPAQAQQPE